MYRKEQGVRSRTCSSGRGLLCKAGRVLRFPFSTRSVMAEEERYKLNNFLYVVQKQSFLFTPNRAKNLINIGLLALFFFSFVCKTMGRRVFL